MFRTAVASRTRHRFWPNTLTSINRLTPSESGVALRFPPQFKPALACDRTIYAPMIALRPPGIFPR